MSAKVKDLNTVGVQRESDNQLLVKVIHFCWFILTVTIDLPLQPELGKIRSRCYSLPGEEFTYGVRSTSLDGGVAEGTVCCV